MAKKTYLNTDRIESLVDGVFAIAMTLLAFDLKIPALLVQVTSTNLSSQLAALLPRFIIYVNSFIILGIYWVGHHIQYNYIEYTDRIFLWINILFLMLIAIIPFSTDLLGRYPYMPVSSVIYGINIILIGIVVFWHWQYATHNHRLVDHDISNSFVSAFNKRILFAPLMALIAIIASFYHIYISLLIYIIVPIYYIKPNKLDDQWKRSAAPHDHPKLAIKVNPKHLNRRHSQDYIYP